MQADRTRKLTLAALLTAAALLLSYIERLLPLTLFGLLPGIKLGLPNIVTLLALTLLGRKTAAAVLVCRCALAALLFGTPVTLLYSLAGGFLAFAVMALLHSLFPRGISLVGLSVAGAAFHHVGQCAMAALLLKSTAAFGMLPGLLLLSPLTGAVTGFVASLLSALYQKSHL